MSEELDLENMPLEDLARLANNPPAPTEQPRNADGTFAAIPPADPVDPPADPVIEEEEEPLHPNQVVHNGELVYRVEVPGVDGGGSQVFYGHGADLQTQMQDVIRQQIEAHANATRKIRSMTQEQKKAEQLSADERFVLQQRLQTEPEVALREQYQRMKEQDPEYIETKQTLTEYKIDKITAKWVAANPDYHAIEANGKRMWGELRRMGVTGVPTLADMDAAYQSLSADGLLKTKPVDPPPTPPAPATPPPPARRSSGLSTRSSAPPVTPSAPQEIDPYEIPLEKLYELAQKQARG